MATSAPHVAIAGQLPPYAVNGEALDFSESLGGPVTDPDLDLWLTLIGAGRILGPRGDYSKLGAFPLHDFLNEQPGAAPIYILAGLENTAALLEIGVSRSADVTWTPATQPIAMPGSPGSLFFRADRLAACFPSASTTELPTPWHRWRAQIERR